MDALVREIVPPDTAAAFVAMRELRPAFTDRNGFVRQVDEEQRPEGYRLVGSFDPSASSSAVAAAGFRLVTNLSSGRHLYIDDLSTLLAARGQGHAGGLLDWIHREAGRLGCAQVHLDSGVGPDRAAAHRLYLTSGYRISAHHFERAG